MRVLVVCESNLDAVEVKAGIRERTANFIVGPTYFYNGFFCVSVEVPDEADIRDLKRSLRARYPGVNNVLIASADEGILEKASK